MVPLDRLALRTAARFGPALDAVLAPRWGRLAATHSALSIRATTHVKGKPTRSSRPARRGAGCWLRATIGVSGRTPMSSSRIAWRRASAARRCLTGRMPGWTRRWGRGSLGHTMTITRRSTVAAGWRSLLPAVAVVRTRPDGALACRPSRNSQRRGEAPLRRPHSRRTSTPLVSGGMKVGLLLSAEVEHLAAASSDRPRTSSTTSTDSDTPSAPACSVKARLRTTPAPARARRSSRASRNPGPRGARPSRCRC